ncbi:MAG: glycogen synthase GlgA [bacterium]
MKIVFATPEMVPYAKTGGLADVCGALLKELSKKEDVCAFLPKHRVVEKVAKKRKKVIDFSIKIGGDEEAVSIEITENLGFPVFLVDSPKYFSRDYLYSTPEGDYPDNDRRFILFNLAVLKAIKELNLNPDVIHCHDWQAGLIPVYIKLNNEYRGIKSILTVHNLGYQGIFPKETLYLAGFSDNEWHYERLEYWGKFSFLKAGLVYSDYITTVSPTYAQQIQTEEYGFGMDGVLRSRKEGLFGILNGIDNDEWNPETDKAIFNYSQKNIKDKVLNKLSLQKKNKLVEDKDIFLIGMTTRLCDQKGLDITSSAIDDIMNMGIQLVLLGTGEEKYHRLLEEMAKKYKKKIGINIKFDDKLARMIYGGCDAFLIPSRYEPCGLTQMIALRYGTIPIVRKTGGLADTIREEENGFVFENHTKEELLSAIQRAYNIFSDKKAWAKMVKDGMKEDFSWKRSMKEYLGIYKR